MRLLHVWLFLVLVSAGLALAACSKAPSSRGEVHSAPHVAASSAALVPVAATRSAAPAKSEKTHLFTPPPESAIPNNEFGAMVREGELIFRHTGKYASVYVGNGLTCEDCHLNGGRRPGSAPLWAAYVRYPRYRSKNHMVNSYADRLRGCFRFSMNGTPPPPGSTVIKAITAYSYWLATGAPTGANLPRAGYPDPGTPSQKPSYDRGLVVFNSDCTLCHSGNGRGQKALGQYVFPPLWGPDSFNWGAGMAKVNTAAAFIKANMPFSLGGSLTIQQAWDVALFMDSHERPQDPRFTGSVAATRKKYHDNRWSMYGETVNGHLLGSRSLPGNRNK